MIPDTASFFKSILTATCLFLPTFGCYQSEGKLAKVQCFAGPCSLLASKCTDACLTEKDISFCTDLTCSVGEVKWLEEIILKQLHWKLAYPTSIDYVVPFSQLVGVKSDSRECSMYHYVLELCLQTTTSERLNPSTLAAAGFILANYCLQKDGISLWPTHLANALGAQLHDLAETVVQLSRDMEEIRDAAPHLTMIRRRYRKPCRHCVGDISIPVILSPRILTSYEERHASA